jgi:diguanylate cyclase (GGDEF)-like protein/putative nucleotidyltransferase with HDIG domain
MASLPSRLRQRINPPLLERLRWTGRGRPGVRISGDRALMARTFAYLFGLGATLLLLTLLLPHSPDRFAPGLIGCAVAAYLTTAAFLIGFDRLPLWLFQASPAVGSLLVSLVVYYGGVSAVGAYAMFFFWVALAAFYFFELRLASLHMAFACFAYAVVLDLRPIGDVPLLYWMMAAGTLFVAGTMMGVLREQVEGLLQQLANAARTDVLTGVTNRRGFEERFTQEFQRASRSSTPLGVIELDLDWFKSVNDRFGHHAGDRALELFSDVLREHTREIDTVARLGGEEFAVIVPEAGEHETYILAERLRQETRSAFGERPEKLTVSCGVAVYPNHGGDPDVLLKAADQALYAAKQLGRDRSVIYSTELAANMTDLGDSHAAQRAGSLATVVSLAEVLDIRHTGTATHSQMVGRYAEAMARALELGEKRVERARLAGLLHDIGKVGIPDSILDKPGPLTDEEWAEMRKHPEIGARIVRNANLDDIAIWILAHHERPDGTGYPLGLSGGQIPIEARILAVADAFEAMTAHRAYKQAMSEPDAREELRRHAGSQFDVEVVDAFLSLPRRDRQPAPDRSLS